MSRVERLSGLVLGAILLLGGCGGGGGGASTSRASAAASSGTGSPAPASYASVAATIGMALPGVPLGATAGEQAERAADLDAVRALGARLVRIDFHWSVIEPARGAFDFAGYDRLVDDAALRGIEVLPILGYGTAWASSGSGGDPYFAPDRASDFGDYVAATARHFLGRVHRYEVWNEPNIGLRFFKPTVAGDPVRFAALVRAAGQAVHAADPAAEVILGGTFALELPGVTPAGLDFVRACAAADPGLPRAFDAIAIHPYRVPQSAPEDAAGQVPLADYLAETRAALAAIGAPGRPIYMTEIGFHTAPFAVPSGGISQAAQAAYFVRTHALALAGGVRATCWYTLLDGPNAQWFQEDAFGVLGPDPGTGAARAPKPIFDAASVFAATAGAATRVEDVSSALGLAADERAVRLDGFPAGGPSRVTILWSPSPGQRAVTIALAGAPRIRAIDLHGQPIALAPAAGAVSLGIGLDPAYLIEGP